MNRYEDALHKNVVPRVAVVITSYIPDNGVREYWLGVKDYKLDTLKMNLASHKHYTPGISYDLIIINNGVTNKEGLEFLNSIGALQRENLGFGFGGWKFAWETFKDKGYSHYLFTEDDMAPTKDGWLRDIFDKFYSEDGIGSVGSYVETHTIDSGIAKQTLVALGSDRKLFYCFDGCFTFTSSEILRQVDTIGGLTVFDCKPHGKLSPSVNELAFQSQILELGYYITSFNDGNHSVVHGGQIFEGGFEDKGPMEPIVNLNGRFKIPEVAKIYEWYQKE